LSRDWLDRLERAGNRLPDPATLFLIGTLLIILLSQLAVSAGWSVDKVVEQNGTPVIQTVAAVSLLDSNGLWWVVSHLVENFCRRCCGG
jgi:aminobenzoyl-glutamate transport protein